MVRYLGTVIFQFRSSRSILVITGFFYCFWAQSHANLNFKIVKTPKNSLDPSDMISKTLKKEKILFIFLI